MSKIFKNIGIFESLILLVIILFNILLVSYPLTNVLGFEFSAVNAILLSFIAGILIIHLLSKEGGKILSLYYSFKQNWLIILLISFLPLVISIISTILTQGCPISEGLLFYFIITLPSLFLGIALGFLSFSLSPKFRYYWFVLFFFVTVFLWIFEIYFNPQIYFYNPVIGFFPGTIYDEDISITATLLFYRVFIVIVSGIIIFVAEKMYNLNWIKKTLVVLLFIFSGIGFYFLKPYVNLATSHERMQNELRGEVKTEHFNIYFSEDIPLEKIKNFVVNHEYYYSQIKKILKRKDDFITTSFIFKSGEQKRKLFGADRADVTKPWLQQIYLNKDDVLNVLKHELAHVFSAKYGTTILKLSHNFNPALIEGFAMAIENNYDNYEVHYLASIAFHSKYKVKLINLFSGFNFYLSTSSFSYIYAGSFMKYLADKYGIEKITYLYGNGDFQKYFGKGIKELSEEYFNFIESYPIDSNKNIANYYFGRKAIFQKYCVRYAANRLKNAWHDYQSGAFNKAKREFSKIYDYSKSYSALAGLVNSLLKTKNNNEAEKILKANLEYFEGSAQYYSLELSLADALVRNYKFNEAKKYYSNLLTQRPRYNYSFLAKLRIDMLNFNSKLLNSYLTASVFDKYELLKYYYTKTKDQASLYSMISLSEQLNQSYSNFMKQLVKKTNKKDIFLNFALFLEGNYSADNSDFKGALNLLQKINHAKELRKFKHSINENIIRLSWIIGNKDRILSSTKFF